MTLAELTTLISSGGHVEVEVHAIDPMIYVAYLVSQGQRRPITERGNRARKFPSRYAATRALSQTGLSEAVFVHRSPYGEMIGLDGSADESEMRERVLLQTEALRSFRPQR
jgi:hypothetical protein